MSPRQREGLRHQRVEFADAAAFVSLHHRRHTPPVGHLFSLGAYQGDRLCGVAIVGRPVARARQDGFTAEVTRLCTDGTRNACSFLLGKAAKAALALGYRRIGTYTLASEGGASLRAAGWRVIGQVDGRSWDTPSRRRTDKTEVADRIAAEPGSRLTVWLTATVGCLMVFTRAYPPGEALPVWPGKEGA